MSENSEDPVKMLGFTLVPGLSWSGRVDILCVRLSGVLFLLRRLRLKMPGAFVKYAFLWIYSVPECVWH